MRSDPSQRLRSTTSLATLLVAGAALHACDASLVPPGAGDELVLAPGSIELTVGEEAHFTPSLLSASGGARTLPPEEVRWSTGDAAVAEVLADGSVVAIGAGNTIIIARFDAAEASASVSVLPRPSLVVSDEEVHFGSITAGPLPPPAEVRVLSDRAPVAGLGTRTEYREGEPDGWLVAELLSRTTPAPLRLSIVGETLPAGVRVAEVILTAPDVESAARITVRYTVELVPPGAPSDVRAEALSPNSVEVSWRQGAGVNERFRVERRVQDEDWREAGTVPTPETAFVDGGLADATDYSYRVFACNDAGCSGPGASASVRTPARAPDAPYTLSASATSASSILLTWTDDGRADTFRLQRRVGTGAWIAAGTVPAPAATFLDGALAPATTYHYRLRGCKEEACSDESPEASATTPDVVPATPGDLVVTGVGALEVSIAWTAGSANETGFRIQRELAGSTDWSVVGLTGPGQTSFTDATVSQQTSYRYRVLACNDIGCSPPTNPVTATTLQLPTVRIVTFGDSNTDCGYLGTDPLCRAASYVSPEPARRSPGSGNSPLQLAGKIEQRWQVLRPEPIVAVNHAISGTGTGGGAGGGPDRTSPGAPNARTEVDGTTRFEAEVLGENVIWSGGEPTNENYPSGAIARVLAFTPGPLDFAYVSLGSNDPLLGLDASQTAANLEWMMDRWLAAGKDPARFVITTLSPPPSPEYEVFPPINDAIRSLASQKGVHLVDLSAYTSDDNSLSWRSESLHVGDGAHYSEIVREWLAQEVVKHIVSVVEASGAVAAHH